jgi:hypothetical protein
MANYASKKFFESEERKRRRRRDPLDPNLRPAAYGMSVSDLDKLVAGRGGRRLLERLEREEGEGE